MVQMTFDDMKQEMARRKTKRDDLLDAFERKRVLYTHEVMEIAGTGMSSRLKELKRKGYLIGATYVSPGLWKYTLLGNREDIDYV